MPNAKNSYEKQNIHDLKKLKLTSRQQKSQRTPEKYFNVIRSKTQQESDEDGPEEVADQRMAGHLERHEAEEE